MKGDLLGEFEELLLMMVALLGDRAYGINLVEEIKSRMRRTVNLSSVHSTLYRMEDKGYVGSDVGGATTERGGRRKRFFHLTSAGRAILYDTQAMRAEIWQLILSKGN